jgi:hypothetical protein
MATTHKSKDSHTSHSSSKSPSSSHSIPTENRKKLDDAKFAFPDERKEPIEDATHVRNAIARFDQVKGVSDEERKKAFTRLKKAAKKFGVEMKETNWKQLGKHPHTADPTQS